MRRRCWLLVTMCLLAPGRAWADAWISPFFGVNLPPSVLGLPTDESNPKTYGVGLGSMGGGVFGFETEVSFSPDFFGPSDKTLLGDNSVFTWMNNVIIGAPIGGQHGAGVRPFATAGVGLIRRRAESVGELVDLSFNNFGYDVGAGVMIFFGHVFGIRGDYRYYRNFQSSEDVLFPGSGVGEQTFSFSRASGAIVLRF